MLAPLALFIDWWLGEPAWLYKRLPHPVVVIGHWASYLERRFNHPGHQRIVLGLLAWGSLVIPVTLAGWFIQNILMSLGPLGFLAMAFLASTLIAYKSLADFVQRIRIALNSGIAPARQAVSHIVGRNVEELDQAGVVRASIESLAENFSDAVVAPLFWLVVGGLPGVMAYKAINTLDSMWGHRNRRYEKFGKAAAILDDLANWVPARLSGQIIILSCYFSRTADAPNAQKAMWRDTKKHTSPNAGWPEAAMAGGLGILLGGPRQYGDETINQPYIGHQQGTADLTARDLDNALQLYRLCGFVTWVGTILLSVIIGALSGHTVVH